METSIFDPSDNLARASSHSSDEVIKAEITAKIGKDWSLASLQGRLQSVRVAGEPQETILLDGQPLVEFYPMEVETLHANGQFTINAILPYRTLSKRQ